MATVKPAARHVSAIRDAASLVRRARRGAELQPVVVGMSGRHDRGAESACNADHDPFRAERGGGRLDRSQAVLDRQHDRIRAEQRMRALGGGAYVHRLRRDHDEVYGADLAGVVRCVQSPTRSPLAPSTRRPRCRIADTWSSEVSITETSLPASASRAARRRTPSLRRRRLRSSRRRGDSRGSADERLDLGDSRGRARATPRRRTSRRYRRGSTTTALVADRASRTTIGRNPSAIASSSCGGRSRPS